MKTVIFLFILGFGLVISSCNNSYEYELPKEQRGSINFYVDFLFHSEIEFGEKYQDSISVWNYDTCNESSYFRVKKIKDFHYSFELYDVRFNGPCFRPVFATNTFFSFTPEKKGNYTLDFKDSDTTFTRTLVVK